MAAAAAAEVLRLANEAAALDDPNDVKPDIVALRADMDRTKARPSNQEIALATTSAIDKLSGMMVTLAGSFNGGPMLTGAQQATWRDETNKIRAINNIALQQAKAAVTNERRVESPPTVTTIFAEELDDPVDNCNNIKILKLPLYNGDEDGNVACLLWLNKIMTAANTGKLTHRATIDLLIDRSENVANSKIRQCKRADMSLTDIVVKLETAFAKVPPPAEARVQVNNMTPNEREDLAHFACRLADVAQIAARDIKPEEERRLAEARMCKTNYLRVLPVHFYNYVTQRELELSRVGKPPLDFEATCLLIEEYQNTQQTKQNRDRADRKKHMMEVQGQEGFRRAPGAQNRRPYNRMRYVYDGEDPDYSEQDAKDAQDAFEQDEKAEQETVRAISELTAEDLPPGDFTRDEVVSFIKQAQRGGYGGYPRNYNNQPRRPYDNTREGYQNRPKPENVRYGGAGDSDEYKLPGLLQDRQPNFPSRQLPELANCDGDPGRCIRCGLITEPVHRQAHISCALYGMPLTDRPCMVCGKGLHFAKNCLKAFQAHNKPLADYRTKN
jgi:hypothetical protein